MFGDRLKELREDSGLKQEDLANLLKVSRQAISAYEIGASEPSIENLIKIADLFHVSLDYMLGRTKEKYNVNLLDGNTRNIIDKVIEALVPYTITKNKG